ncbi:hypothetical protein B0T10DRAFT_486940 [Thelonectria olida]|uniref:NB-ARC domain-containing protein n=1 Tax=Thelonectria olida TaxID=1576542 RepID=A0A9P9AQ57_9HYPO|nr:hypothetical protein B0T10DRAFT_486940 [Thelonectria olida]
MTALALPGKPSRRSIPIDDVFSVVPFRRDPSFVKRGDFLDRIRHTCVTLGEWAVLQGPEGVGKTHLAIEFAHSLLEEKISVFWVDSSTPDTLDKSVRTIANACKVPQNVKQPVAEVTRAVCEWLRQAACRNGLKWCVIVDGAGDEGRLFGTAIDGCRQENCYILATTRDEALAAKMSTIDVKVQRVGPMSRKEALVLYQMKFGATPDDDMWRMAGKLVQRLNFNPEAITRAAIWRRQNPSQPLAQFLTPMRLGEFAPSSLPGINKEIPSEEEKSAAQRAWGAAINRLENERPSAASLLFLMSLFDDQPIPGWVLELNGVPREPQAHFPSTDNSPGSLWVETGIKHYDSLGIKFREEVRLLLNCFLITWDEDDDTFEMHSYVQAAARRRLEAKGELAKYEQEYISRLARVLPTTDYLHFERVRALRTHFVKVLDYPQPDDAAQLQRATVLHNGSSLIMTIGDYEVALDLIKMAVPIRRALLGEDHEMTLESMNAHALLLCYTKKITEAQKLQEAAIDTATDVLGKDHRITLEGTYHLTPIYWNLGRASEALEIVEDLAEKRKRLFGDEDEETLSSIGMLAHVYWVIDRFDKAESISSEVVETRRRVSGEDHPNTLSCINTLGSIYCDKGRFWNAEEILLPAIERMNRVMGESHPETLCTVLGLALAYASMARWKEVEEMQASVMKEIHLHANLSFEPTFSAFNRLLKLQVTVGSKAKALELMWPFMAMVKQVLGNESFEMTACLETLTNTLQAQFMSEKAEPYEADALAIMIKLAGESNATTMNWMDKLANTRWRLGKKDEAVELMQKCVELRQKMLGPEHEDTIKSVAALEEWEKSRRRFSWMRKLGRSKKS